MKCISWEEDIMKIKFEYLRPTEIGYSCPFCCALFPFVEGAMRHEAEIERNGGKYCNDGCYRG